MDTQYSCIVQDFEVIKENSCLVIVMELANGGELYKQVQDVSLKIRGFNEKIVKLQFYQIVSAVKYLHENNY